jgi:xylulokinase
MARLVLAGVDIGTSSSKGAAFDEGGRCLASAEVAYRYESPRRGWAQADAEAWWEATREILHVLVQSVRPAVIDAVAVTGQAPTLLLVDEAGSPIHPAILWLDVRSEGLVEDIARRAGPDGERAAGNRFHAYYLGPKLAWLRRREPQLFEHPVTVLQSHSYPVLRLTGARVTDPSSAALCAPLYDCRARRWSGEVCARLDVDVAWLPEIRPSHAVAGRVTAEAARESGLREGTPVAVGGADFAASTLAAGVTAPGEACLMLGTAGNLVMPLATPDFDLRLINTHHVGCDRYLALGGTLAGAVQEWLRSIAAPGAVFEVLETEAAAVPAGADGLRLLPYLQGERTPVWDATVRGAFAGLSIAHGRGHLYRAVLEGVAVSFRDSAEIAAERGLRLNEVIAVNGGARSPLWRQILCDALGVPLLYMPDSAGAPAGAALLAGMAIGALDAAAAARRWRGPLLRHSPDPSRTAVYEAMAAARPRLYEAVRAIA